MAKELRQDLIGVLTLVIVSLVVYSLVRVSSHAAIADPTASALVQTGDGSDHYLRGAVYSTTGGQTSHLLLNNSQNHSMTAHVTLYNKHGLPLTVPEITLGPHKNESWNIHDWVSGVNGFEEGSFVVFYHGLAMSLHAQVTITNPNHSLSFDVHPDEAMDFMSSRVDGLWWALDNHTDATVFIANTRATQTNATPVFYVGGAAYEGETITLSPYESDAIDIDKALKRLHVSGNTSVGGISLTYTNGPGAMAVVGVVSNKHTGFSTTMRFIDQASQRANSLHGANLLIGKPGANSGFPATTRFTPHVIVRNNTEQSVQVNPRIRYTLFEQPHNIELPALTLSANEVRQLDLSSVINAIGNDAAGDAGLEIDHTGQPGAVMVYAASVDQAGSDVFDVPVKDPTHMPFKGGSNPWHIDGNNRAMLHVKSVDIPGDGQKRQFMVKLYFEGGEYNLPLQEVEAGQTDEVDIKKLRDDQVPDALGNAIPLNVTAGQLDWYGKANNGLFIGRLVQYNSVTGTSSSFSCEGACLCNPGFFRGWFTPGPISGFVGNEFSIGGIEEDADCNGNNHFTFPIYGAEFISSNTNVVTISGSTATLVGPGNAQIDVNWEATSVTQHCFLSAEGECVDATCSFASIPLPIGGGGVVVDTLRAFIPDPPVTETNGNPGVIAGQSFAVRLQAIDASGNINLGNSSTVAVSISRTLDSTEIGLPSSVTLSGGQYTASVRFNRVNGTDRGTTFRFTPIGGGYVDLPVYTYFQVTASLEDLVGHTTACGHVITSNDHFVALPSTGLCNTAVVVRNAAFPLQVDSTTVREVGPWFPNTPGPGNSNPCSGGNDPYWNTGGVPRVLSTTCDTNNAAIDLANGTASTISISGLGSVLWRFN